MIGPFPNESTDIAGVIFHQLIIMTQVAAGVAHRVGIFTKNERLLRIILNIILAIPRAHIHRAENIGPRIVRRLLILYRARRIERADSLILRDKIIAGDT